MFDDKYKFTCVEKFLRYVKYDTQSDEESSSFPSTAKQKNLSSDLAKELKGMGLKDAHMDENGYVIATLPSNTAKKVPVISFIAHVDTSPAVTGENVIPIIHKDYRGGDIKLPNDPYQVIKASENPDLKNMIGYDIITTDGTT
jgi:tripeptide aminopeptidase